MAIPIAIAGDSGTGKSTSIGSIPELGIEGLSPKETVIINVNNQNLPFRGAYKDYNPDRKISDGGNYVATDSTDDILNILQYISASRTDIKNIVVDDAGFLMTNAFMRSANQKGYDKFGGIAMAGWRPVDIVKTLRNDLKVFFIYHVEEKDVTGKLKIKTSGKMIDNHVTMEALFTIILYSFSKLDPKDRTIKCFFRTQNDGVAVAKSPHGMFGTLDIPNDLGFVVKAINQYYGFN